MKEKKRKAIKILNQDGGGSYQVYFNGETSHCGRNPTYVHKWKQREMLKRRYQAEQAAPPNPSFSLSPPTRD